MPINRPSPVSPLSPLGGVSGRELARRANISEAAVRRHARAGTLDNARLPDGTWEPVKALALLRGAVTKARSADPRLRQAADRLTAAQVGLLEDEVADMQRRYIPVADAEAIARGVTERLASHLRPLAASIATAAGLPAKLVFEHASTSIHNALSAISTEFLAEDAWWDQPADAWWEESTPGARAPLSAVALKTAKLDLGATKLTIERMIRNGEVRSVAEVVREAGERIATAKSVLLAIPSRVDQRLSVATTAEARALVSKEVAGVLRELGATS